MGYGNCCGPSGGIYVIRRYRTNEERAGKLKEYQNELERELQGVKERIQKLEAE